MTPDEFRRHGHAVVDWIADYRERVQDRPVMAPVAPGDIKALLPSAPPAEGEPFERILADLDRVVVPGLSHWQHPQFFGYFPSNGTLASVLGDYVSTGLGVLGLAWQSSPALTELEEVATGWLRQMVGLSRAVGRRDSGHGVHQHAAGAHLRARADHRLRPRARRAARRGAAADRVRIGSQPQFRGQGRAAGGLRPREHPPHRSRRGVRDAARQRWPRRSPRTGRRAGARAPS